MQNKRSKFLHPIYKLSPVTWLLKHTIPHLDRLFFKLSNGKRSFSQPLSGLPTFLIKHRGAKTGTTRTTPLICIPHGNDNEEIILIASNFGRNNNPAWYYNIKAHPEIIVNIKGKEFNYIATEIEDNYTEYWEKAVNLYAGYQDYRNKTKRTHIPILLLKRLN